jgi:hypothetical protein
MDLDPIFVCVADPDQGSNAHSRIPDPQPMSGEPKDILSLFCCLCWIRDPGQSITVLLTKQIAT